MTVPIPACKLQQAAAGLRRIDAKAAAFPVHVLPALPRSWVCTGDIQMAPLPQETPGISQNPFDGLQKNLFHVGLLSIRTAA